MQTARAIYGWDTPFSKATDKAVLEGKNNARGLEGLDMATRGVLNAADGADRNHGICCGISAAWVVAVCNGVPDATDPFAFQKHYFTVLRFQGSYIKEVQSDYEGSTGKHLVAMFSAGSGSNIKLHSEKEVADTSRLSLPSEPWAAYMKLPKHAVACGGTNGKFYIMEPNRGLFEYTSEFAWRLDLAALIRFRNLHKGKAAENKVTFYFYVPE